MTLLCALFVHHHLSPAVITSTGIRTYPSRLDYEFIEISVIDRECGQIDISLASDGWSLNNDIVYFLTADVGLIAQR